MEIVSKRHFYRFYVSLILVNLFIFGVASLFLITGIRNGNNVGPLVSLPFFALGIYSIYISIKFSPKIVLNEKGILCKNKFHNWEDISNITLTGKRRLFLGSVAECAALSFNNLQTIIIFDMYYENSAEMKYFIQQVVIDKKAGLDFRNKKINAANIEKELFIPFKGHPVFSFRGALMWGLILFILLMPFYLKRKLYWDISHLFLIGFSLFWFVLNASMMNYFEVSNKYFVVKNHFFFWKRIVYPLSDIHEIVYEQQGKMPNSLRVITTKFSTKLYPAGTLTSTTWLDMQDELVKKNIRVRNECIW